MSNFRAFIIGAVIGFLVLVITVPVPADEHTARSLLFGFCLVGGLLGIAVKGK